MPQGEGKVTELRKVGKIAMLGCKHMEKEELDSLFKYVQKHGIDHITGAILPHKSSTESFEDAVPPREPEDIPTIR